MEKVNDKPRVMVGQVWDVADDAGIWHRAEVINVLGQWIELRYLDTPDANNPQNIRSFTNDEMAARAKFRHVS